MLNHVCLSALLLAGLLQQPPTEAGWTSLFNGKDFAGWKISKPESFTIDNGAIVANGAASRAYYDGSFRNTAPCISGTSGSSRSTDQKENVWRR